MRRISRSHSQHAPLASARARQPRIVDAVAAQVDEIDRLRRADASSLGFLSRVALREKIALGHVRVAICRGKVIGCLIHGSLRGPEVRLFVLAVDRAWRGRGVGRLLLHDLLQKARTRCAQAISLRCRENLRANGFWHGVGFKLHDLEAGRNGALFVWTRRTRRGGDARGRSSDFQFHTRWHRCPRCQRWTCDTWTTHARRVKTCESCTQRGFCAS